jgi:predicted nucleic acid-binding protein
MVGNPLRGNLLYVDANTFIYALETPNQFPGLKQHFVQPFLQGDLQIVTSWITLAEVLVKPIQSGDDRLEAYYRQVISASDNFSVVAVDEEICSAAAILRAVHGIKLPDAIHVATWQLASCVNFLNERCSMGEDGRQCD